MRHRELDLSNSPHVEQGMRGREWLKKHLEAIENDHTAASQVSGLHENVCPRQCLAKGWCHLRHALLRVEHETRPPPKEQQILPKCPEHPEDMTPLSKSNLALKIATAGEAEQHHLLTACAT